MNDDAGGDKTMWYTSGTAWERLTGTIWTTGGQCEMQWDDVEQVDVGMKSTSEKGLGYDDLVCC